MEPRAINYIKWRYPEPLLNVEKNLLLAVKLPIWMANPDLQMSLYNPIFEPKPGTARPGDNEEYEFQVTAAEG